MTVEELNTDPPTEKIEVGARTVNLRPVIIPGPTTTMTPPDPPTQVITDLPTHTVVLPKVSTDPLDELVDRMRPALTRAVDALQVAAALEADGFTDRVARVEYGFSDVFALALEVFRRLGPPTDHVADVVPTVHGWRATVRMLAHGPLYLLPSAVFPAVLAVLGQRSVAIALTVASGLGWMYAGTAAYGAYRLLGAHRPGGAARVLRGATLAAPVAGALAGLGVVAIAGGGWGLVVMAACQLGYQLAGTVLVFYRREILQAASMVPAVLAGCGYLLAGPALRPAALVTAVAGATAAFLIALGLTRGRGTDGEPKAGPLLRHRQAGLQSGLGWWVGRLDGGLIGVACYGLASAVLLLHAEAPYLLSRLDVAVAVAPLIAAMGYVEWRAELFRGRAVRLTRNSHRPGEFGRRVWLMLARETLGCLAVPGALGLILMAGLAAADRLSAPGAVMIAAHVVIGGAFYSAFLLAGFERFGWLCASMAAALALHVGLGAALGASPLLGQSAAPLTDTTLYLGSVLALQGLFLLGLRPILGQVRHYR